MGGSHAGSNHQWVVARLPLDQRLCLDEPASIHTKARARACSVCQGVLVWVGHWQRLGVELGVAHVTEP